MGRIGIYVERYTISNSDEMNALMRFAHEARRLGHRADFLFRPDMFKIPECDAIFIRAMTDPLNSSYVAARTAEMHGIPVLDQPESIMVCCDKVNMYRHLVKAGVPMPETVFLTEDDVTAKGAEELFETLGRPLVLKAPHSSFSMYVDRASDSNEFLTIGKRYFRRSDLIVAQRFTSSEFDWRVGVLDGEPLYVCRYLIPKRRWKILTYTAEGRAVYGPIKALALQEADQALIDCALAAADSVGKGLYGVDLKQVDDRYLVIEVNDNPTIIVGDEDQKAGDLYGRIIRYLLK